MPRMEACGWSVKLPFLRFWDGERDKQALLKGLSDRNDIQLVSYVFDTYFEPLLRRPAPGDEQVVSGSHDELWWWWERQHWRQQQREYGDSTCCNSSSVSRKSGK